MNQKYDILVTFVFKWQNALNFAEHPTSNPFSFIPRIISWATSLKSEITEKVFRPALGCGKHPKAGQNKQQTMVKFDLAMMIIACSTISSDFQF